MRFRLYPLLLPALVAALPLVEPPGSFGQGAVADPLAAPPAGVEVQARGAIHEAFAEPNGVRPAPGPVVPKEPPRNIDETPPEEKPQGDNIVWIPGYWSRDEEATDFVWISGFWRAVPAGRTWVPGTWQRTAGGARWVSGYWGVAAQEETEYLAEPPPSLDRGPSTPAPGADYSYVPGLWVYQVNRFVWRPGYWLAYRPGWVWVPATYRWTPCGFVYVPGYWDVPILDRGLLFAPVRFPTAVYLRPGFVYRPAYCIQPDFLCGALFIRTGAPGYFFGDYFGPRYRAGYVSWVSFRFGGGVGLDLNFSYYRHAYRDYPAWERGLSGLYSGRYAGTIAAPPRTLVQQNTVVNNIIVNKTTNTIVNKTVNITNIQNVSVLAPVTKINKVNVTAMSSLTGVAPAALKAPPVSRQLRVERLTPARLQEEKNAAVRYQAIARERRTTEANLAVKAPKVEAAAPLRARIELPRGTPPAPVFRSPAVPKPARPKAEWHPEVKPAVKPVLTPPPPKVITAPPPPLKATTPPPPAKDKKAEKKDGKGTL
jgi:hypothetical protein